MNPGRVAALLYVVVSTGVAVFQIALAAGLPLGAYAMGGAFPGRFPPVLRVAATVQGFLVVGMALVVMSRAGVTLCQWTRVSRRLVWVVVAVGAAGLFLNLFTPSPEERAIWAPVAGVMLCSSLIVALQRNPDQKNGSVDR